MWFVLILALGTVLLPAWRPHNLHDLAFRILCLACATSAWIGIHAGAFSLSDPLFAGALVLALCAQPNLSAVPLRALLGPVLIGVAAISSLAFPVDLTSLPEVEVVSADSPLSTSGGALTNVARFEVGLVVVPLAVLLLRCSAQEVRRLADAWALGAAVSAFVAVLDRAGVTHIQSSLLGSFAIQDRNSGLTLTPNDLAVTCVLVVPVFLTWLSSRNSQSRRVLGAVLVALVLLADYFTDSRGGFVAALAVLVLGATLGVGAQWVRRNPHLVTMVLLGGLSVALLPPVARAIGASRVFHADETTASSDATRSLLRARSEEAFWRRPLSGSSFSLLESGHSLPLQLLAAGGLLALAGFGIFIGNALWGARRARAFEPSLVWALQMATVGWLIFGLIENEIVNRFLYVPVALLLALTALAAERGRATEQDLADILPPIADAQVLAPYAEWSIRAGRDGVTPVGVPYAAMAGADGDRA